MGIEVVVLGLFVIQALVVILLAACATFARCWLDMAALLLGALIGFSLFVIPRSLGWSLGEHPAASLFGGSFVLVLISAVLLAYLTRRRWVALAAFLVLLVIPDLYVLMRFSLSPHEELLGSLKVWGDLNFFLAPIACALALREVVLGVSQRVIRFRECTA
jgi:hypothetical protein